MTAIILESNTEGAVPFLLVRANDEADAEIFADENAVEFDSYFEGMQTNGAKPTIEENVFRVNFCDKIELKEQNDEARCRGLYNRFDSDHYFFK